MVRLLAGSPKVTSPLCQVGATVSRTTPTAVRKDSNPLRARARRRAIVTTCAMTSHVVDRTDHRPLGRVDFDEPGLRQQKAHFEQSRSPGRRPRKRASKPQQDLPTLARTFAYKDPIVRSQAAFFDSAQAPRHPFACNRKNPFGLFLFLAMEMESDPPDSYDFAQAVGLNPALAHPRALRATSKGRSSSVCTITVPAANYSGGAGKRPSRHILQAVL